MESRRQKVGRFAAAITTALALTGISCSSGSSSDSAENLTLSDVAVAGKFSTASVGSAPCYWKDGAVVVLPQATSKGGTAYTDSHGLGIGVVGGDVYVAGLFDGDYAACLWKNGVAADITTADGSWLSDLSVFDGKVYTPGAIYSIDWSAAYYVDGAWVACTVPDGYSYSYLNGLAVSGSDVYGVGGAGSNLPYWWKNGTPTALPLPASYTKAEAEAVALSGTDVYAAGYAYDGSSPDAACLWRNGSLQILDLPSQCSGGEAYDIGVVDSTVYAVGEGYYDSDGSTIYVPIVWKGGAAEVLPLPSSAAGGGWVNSLSSAKGGVYYTGAYQKTVGGSYMPCAWIDGQCVDLPLPADATGADTTKSAEKRAASLRVRRSSGGPAGN